MPLAFCLSSLADFIEGARYEYYLIVKLSAKKIITLAVDAIANIKETFQLQDGVISYIVLLGFVPLPNLQDQRSYW
ncbi:hypothetical protein [Crocosphaera chwakensis]|uniref:hypothetical protein n=1 Tax=Crocosphaera chwakensis TaxID=2546361 RepID=UPI00056092DF|nr:hypothetical protein [Crocosphaera chwakensis]